MSLSPYRSRTLIRYGNFMFRYRNIAFPAVFVLLLVVSPHSMSWVGTGYDLWIDAAALLVAFAGEGIRVVTVGLEYIKRGGLNKQVYANNLVTEGMFSHCRNPLYVGNVMMAFALLTMSGQLDILIIGGVLILITYVAIIGAEEEYLRKSFPGEYEDYCRRVNRWMPDLRGLGDTLGQSRFNWRRVLLKESSSFYAWITLAFLLAAVQHRFVMSKTDLPLFLGLFVVATLSFASIRILKKTGRLHL